MSSNRMNNFRLRSEDNDTKGEEEVSPRPITASTLSGRSQVLTAVQPKIHKPDRPKRLSFVDEEVDSTGITTILDYLEKRYLKDLIKKHSEFISYLIFLWIKKTTEKEISDGEYEEEKKDTEEGKIENIDEEKEAKEKKKKKIKEVSHEKIVGEQAETHLDEEAWRNY